MPVEPPAGPLLTIREASQATGLSVKALRGRVERGSLQAVTLGDRRRIPLAELVRAGLIITAAPRSGRRTRTKRGTSSGYPSPDNESPLALVLERLDDLGRRVTVLAETIEELRREVRKSREVGP